MRKLLLFFSILSLLFSNQSNAQTTVQIGTGTDVPANTLYGPVYRFSATSATTGSRANILITASEMSAAGIPNGAIITEVAFNKTNSANFVTPATYSMYMANTNNTSLQTSLTWASIQSTHTQVYSNNSFNIPLAAGWVTWDITDFTYTGGALEIANECSMVGNGGATDAFKWEYTNSVPADMIVGVASPTGTVLNGAVAAYKHRPNIKITYIMPYPCSNPITAGSTVSTATYVCAGSNFMLSLTGQSIGTGLTYQWQSSTTGGAPWDDIVGAVNSSLDTNQTTTTWYRCAMQCSGGSIAYSTPIEITTPSLIGGTYTINDALPTGGGNFASFADAISYIGCGINAPVVFNVEPGSGPYLEQVVINPIGGASATNTVTFNGNGATIQYSSSNSAARAGIHLNGADHIIIDSLNIDGSAGTYAWGVVLTNRADSNIIRKCTINVGSNVTTSNYLGIIINGSATTTSTAGNNGNGNLIENNHIIGGYYGMFIYGGSTFPSDNNNNKIIGNTIEDYYYCAMYVYYQSSGLVISKNDISRPTRTTVTTTYGPTYGLYIGTGSVGALIEKNRIHNLFDGAPNSTSLTYCLYLLTDGTAANPTRVENNAIYSIGGNGSLYGLYNSGAAYMKAYHNTISLDNTAATAGATYGFYQVTSDNGIEFKNNIVNITRGGSGAKYCIYKSTAATPIASDNNVLYVNSAGSGAQNIGYQTTAQATLTDWQTATSQDGNSISVDPLFADPTMGDYTPTESQVDDMGAPLGVMTDILDSTRSAATPDPGAWELAPVAGIDIKPESLYSPTESAEGCYNTETLVVRVKNSGTQDINFATNNLTVTISVTGAATATYSATVTSGMLVSGATQDITMATPGATLDMSVVGQYSFEITTNLVGDINPANNTITQTREKIALSGGTAGASPDSYCAVGGTPTLSVTGAEGYSSVQWQSSTTSGSGFSDISGATTATYTLSTAISQTMYFRLKAVCGSNTEYSMEKEVVLNNPQLTSTTPGSRCGPGSVTLGATSNASTINWYENPTGGTPVGTGNSFTTPLILSTTTYYAAAGDGGNTQGIPGDGGWDHVTASGAFQTTTITSAYMILTVSQQLTLSSFDIYPSATIGTAFSIEARTGSASGPMYKSYTGTTTVTNSGTPTTAQTVPVNWDLAPGTYYIGFISNPNTWRSSATHTFPWTISGLVSLDYYLTPSYQYYFYNLQISTGCESARTPVTATINTPPAITASAVDATICIGSSTDLSVSSSNGGYAYTWTPGNHAGATYNVSPTATTKYYVNAEDGSGGPYTGCANIDSVTVTVAFPTPVIITTSRPGICENGDASKMYTNIGIITVLSEDFETGAIDWTKTNTSTGGTPANAAWTIHPSPTTLSSQSVSSNDASHFYHTNSDAQGSGSTANTTLTSPAINTMGYESLSLEFYHYYRHLTAPAAFVKVSTDGNTWNTVYTSPNANVGTASAFVKETINLDAYINNPTLYIRFHYITAGWWYGWAIDNVLVKGNTSGSTTWTPTTGLFTDATATTPYAGGVIDTVYAKPTSTTTYTATITNAGNCVSTKNQEIAIYPGGAWNGSVSTDWSNASNWCGGVPTASTNIVIPSTAERMPAISNGSQVGNSINFNDATTLSIASGASLNVTNVIANGNTTLSGLGSLNTSGSFSFGNVNNKTFTSAGVITLKSTATGTGRIADITNGGANSGNAISGNITQERYIPAKASRKWIFLSSPLTQTVQNSWQQQIHVTGSGTGGTVCPTLSAHTNGFDATATNAPSMYVYDASQAQGSRWASITNTNSTNVGQGVGFRVNVRGDRSRGCELLDGSQSGLVPTATTLKASGVLGVAQKNFGSFSITYPNNGVGNYVFIGNPYPSAISFSALQGVNAAAIGSTYAIYVPASSPGTYSYWDDNAGEFTGGTGYDDATGDIIANGQAVFLESSVAGNLTLNFNEELKTTETNTGYFRPARVFNEKVKVSYLQNNNKVDEVVIRYANDAGVSNTEKGKLDITSMNSGTYISSLKGGKEMVVQTRDLRTLSNDEVWLNIGATASGTYQLSFSEFENFGGTEIILKDHYTGTEQNIKQNDKYEFSVDKDNAATKGSTRFSVVFNRTVNPEYVSNIIKLYPNPASKQVTLELPQVADNSIVYNVRVTDIAGKVVMQQKVNAGTHQLTIDRLTTGTYFVEIIDSKGNRTTEKLVKN